MQKSLDDFEEDDFRRQVPRYSKENFPNILKLADGLKKIGEKYNATPGQVALAWVLAQGEDVIPIPGTTKIPVSDHAFRYVYSATHILPVEPQRKP